MTGDSGLQLSWKSGGSPTVTIRRREASSRCSVVSSSTRAPTVRLLEGNLRIRKAQSITAADIIGTKAATDDVFIY